MAQLWGKCHDGVLPVRLVGESLDRIGHKEIFKLHAKYAAVALMFVRLTYSEREDSFTGLQLVCISDQSQYIL